MHEHWLPKWREAQRHFLTPNNYDSTTPEEAVLAILTERIAGVERKHGLSPVRELRRRVSFELPAVEHLGRVVRGEVDGEFYARAGFAERKALEQMLLALEAGYAGESAPTLMDAALFPSGMSAIDTVARELARHINPHARFDKRFLRGETVYTHSKAVFAERMAEYGFGPAVVVDTTKPENVASALERHNGQIVAVYFEPVTNPLIEYTDTRAIAEIAHDQGVPVVVDNTFLTPYLQQPLRMGADIVIHSVTKYLNGFGSMLAGAVVGPKAFMRGLKELQVQSGAVIQSTSIADQLYHAFRTFPRRMATQVKNAATLADFLRDQPAVAEVYHPHLGTETRGGSPGAVISFMLAGATPEERTAREKALMRYLIDSNHHPVAYEVSLGDSRYLMIGETTLGLPSSFQPGLVRFAVGREPRTEQVIAYLGEALRQTCK